MGMLHYIVNYTIVKHNFRSNACTFGIAELIFQELRIAGFMIVELGTHLYMYVCNAIK